MPLLLLYLLLDLTTASAAVAQAAATIAFVVTSPGLTRQRRRVPSAAPIFRGGAGYHHDPRLNPIVDPRDPIICATSSSSCPLIRQSTYLSTTSLSFSIGDSSVASLILARDGDVADVVAVASSSWRQYVPVVVIGLVLIDILLGSPIANSVLNKARSEASEDGGRRLDDNSMVRDDFPADTGASLLWGSRGKNQSKKRQTSYSSKPRIDVDAYAKAALERAEGVTQLRDYLESRKTDYDRMEDMKREMDRKMEELDRKNRVQQEREE